MQSIAVVGAVLSAAGTIVGGLATYQQLAYQKAVAEMNAKVAEENAQRAIYRSQIEAQEQDDQTAALIGEQIAIQGASGLGVGSKSHLMTRKAAARLGRLDALRVRQAGEIEAYNYRVQEANFQAEADSISPGLSLVGTFLKAGAGFASDISGSSIIGNARSAGAQRFNPVPIPRPRPVSILI